MLQERLKTDFISAMKEKNKCKKDIIQLIRASITNLAIDKKMTEYELTDEDILRLIHKELKQQNDSLDAFVNAKREDLAIETKTKIEILKNYLPKQLTEEELTDIIKDNITKLNITKLDSKSMGIIMKNIMPKIKGRADGKTVNAIINKIIGS